MELDKRGYQDRTVSAVWERWAQRRRSVLVVSPPGSGKTEMGMLLVDRLRDDEKVLWVVHTRELALQALQRLRKKFGDERVGAIMGGYVETPGARITVATVQSLLLRGGALDVDLVVLDEAHHYPAEAWRTVLDLMRRKPRVLGLTATPERDDGAPLGDIFDDLVVAAHYSELRREGHIVPVRVVAPVRDLGSDFAQHPVDAYAQWSGGGSAFAFFPLIKTARMYAEEWIMRGVDARCVHSEETKQERAATFEAFEKGECRVMSTVAAIIEGVNVPAASVAILGRSFDFIGGYLQATGRILRPDKGSGKTFATVIDLTGATLRHGPPDQDREYSLTGKGIVSRSSSGGSPPPGGVVGEPEVYGVDMRVTYGAEVADGHSPLALPERDPGRLRAWRKARDRYRDLMTRRGRIAAEQAREYESRRHI